MNNVGYTCQITAAFRAVEFANIAEPVIRDPLAVHLAGEALPRAQQDWQQLVEAQGPGKSLRIPARNRVMDDLLLQALQVLTVQCKQQPMQVVNVGCGMDTKPWRLQLPLANMHWFDIDQPAVMQLKQQLLHQAGAATTSQTVTDNSRSMLQSSQPTSCHNSVAVQEGSSSAVAAAAAAYNSLAGAQQQPQQQGSFPLMVKCWHPVAADLAEVPLADCLQAVGFNTSYPTVWLAEALLYYLPLHNACELLQAMHKLSGPGSKLIATCIDKELQVAHQNLSQDHYFASSKVSWHFSVEDLLPAQLQGNGWQLGMQPRTSADLALEWYGKSTYVALYGGAEFCFTAELL